MPDDPSAGSRPAVAPSPARELALDVLLDVDRRDAYATLALDARLRRRDYSRRDKGLATELVYGVLRRRGTLDWIIERAANRPPGAIDPVPRCLLRLALYQALYLRSIPGPVACHQAVESAKQRGLKRLAGFVNAVCRKVTARDLQAWEASFPPLERDPVTHLSIATSHPQWMVERWVRRLGSEETEALCLADNVPPATSIRVNTLRTAPLEVQRAFADRDVDARPSCWLPEVLLLERGGHAAAGELFRHGLYMVQDEAAALVSRVVDPKPGERILDLAAAPGGKSTHLAQLAGDGAEIVAVELHGGKARLIEENVGRMGIGSVRVEVADIRDLSARYTGWADRVLLDAPCSGLGLLRKKPDIRWRRTPHEIESLAGIQAELLRSATALVRPGGLMVYSTCTTEPEEDEDLVKRFMSGASEFTSESVVDALPPSGRARFEKSPGPQADVGLHLYPHHHGTDGFYIARLRRTS